MPFGRLTIALVAGSLLAPAAVAVAHAQSERAEFDQNYSHFKDLYRESAKLQDGYAAASPDEKVEIRKKYVELTREQSVLIPKLKQLAEKAYLADPKDEKMGNFVFVTAVTAMETDEYEEVVRLAKLLIDRNFSRDALFNMAGTAAFFINDYDDADTWLNRARSNGALDDHGAKLLDDIPEYRQKWAREQAFRAAEAKADDLPRVRLTIGDAHNRVKGVVVVELFENEAPNTVANFISLVSKHFYDGAPFHRVLPGFMAQGGDAKNKDGTGGPGYRIADECYLPNHREHFRGSLSMAHAAERNTGGSQFFINFAPTKHLDGLHTVFGRVIEGMDVVTQLRRIDPDHPGPLKIEPDKILKAEVIRKRPHDYTPETLQ